MKDEMTPSEKVKFDGLNALWNTQTESSVYHIEIATEIIKKSNKTNRELKEMEQKFGVKRELSKTLKEKS